MNKYIDLIMKQSPELPTQSLMSAVFEQIHRSLVAMDSKQVGISFPSVSNSYIGNKIRLHGSDANLAHLVSFGWLEQFKGYVEQSEILDVPVNAGHRLVSRKRIQKPASLSEINRHMRRHGVTKEVAEETFKAKAYKPHHALPYLWVQSQSSGGVLFKLYVEQQAANQYAPGLFNAYGLSSSATVPWF